MAKKDVVVRTAADLERKYNFASLLGLKKNVEITTQGIQKIENELSSMLNALVINLKDVLGTQNEISLYFYSGIPTKENSPYKDWSNPSDHIGDIYYDQNTGYVYQYNGVWEVNTSPDLVEAMAITNAELDTSKDHERKVFFDTPTIPYSNGDWWIKEDGTLFICQISKTSGTYEKDDFINSSNYTESIAEKIGEEIKVLKGTITMISENYAKFTDLATGGSTVISGDNITTGNIQSQNYIKNVSGTKISLENGIIDSKNFKVNETGDMKCTSGEIAGFILTDNYFAVDITPEYAYTEADLDKIRKHYFGTITLTEEEIERLDANKDGVVDLFDAVIVQNFISSNITPDKPGKFEIIANSGLYNIVLTDGNGDIKTSMGLNGITTNKLSCSDVEGIVESGSNDLGSWTKWVDGTMICRSTKDYSITTPNSLGALYYGYRKLDDFPQPFIERPDITYSHFDGRDCIALQPYSFDAPDAVSKTSAGAVFPITATQHTTAYDISISYIAIGKWK